MKQQPDLSFIIPVYNMAATLPGTLNSLYQIEDLLFEIVIVDDGSNVSVAESVEKLVDMAPVPVHIFRTENRGRAEAINEGLRHAVGRYVSFVDADDFIDPKEFLGLISIIKLGLYDLIIGQFKIIGENGKVFDVRSHNEHPTKEKLVKRIAYFPLAPVHLNAFVIKKFLLDEVGMFDSNNLKSEDKDMTIRLLRAATSVKFCNTFNYHYHKHNIGRSKKVQKRLEWILYRQRMISRNFEGVEKIASKTLQFFYDSAKLLYEATVGYKKY